MIVARRIHGPERARANRRGMTLVELIIAAFLSSIVMLALVRLVDSATDIWTKGEQRRALVEQAAATGELVARDLRSLHAGSRGDLIVDWYPHDIDRDGRFERLWPRIRLVRTASPADLARLRSRAAADVARAARIVRGDKGEDALGELTVEELAAAARGKAGEEGEQEVDPATLPPVDIGSIGLMEVLWAVVPRATKGEGRYEGLLVRGERLVVANAPGRLLADDVFDRQGRPGLEFVEEISGGILWFDVRLATQTTTLDSKKGDGGWRIGRALTDAATSWDAYSQGRPNVDLHAWNEPGAGMPPPSTGSPHLPRRVRLELEIQRERDRARRTRLVSEVEVDAVRVDVENGQGLNELPGRFALVAGEWLRVKSVDGDSMIVDRAQRGTARRALPAGSLVHFGEALVIEVPIVLHRDDWTLTDEERE
jgi:type II secretory pathway pseudopilin PulG